MDRLRGVIAFPLRALTSMRFWWFVCLLWAAILAWAGRRAMNPDGVSYLDMASGSISQGTGQLINGYWSPGYPAIIALALMLFHPSPIQEFPIVHAVNFGIFALALSAFTFLIKSWIECDSDSRHNEAEMAHHIIPFAFGIFLWFIAGFIGLSVVTPDLLLAAMVFTDVGIAFRLVRSRSTSLRWYTILGGALGLGFYVKAVLLSSGLALLAVLFVFRPGNLSRKRIVVSGLVLAATATPLIGLISLRVGRLSVGETGTFAYITCVNHRELIPHGAWIGDFGTLYPSLTHPPRMLAEKPATIEFTTPMPGTFPLWYDVTYWWSGARAHFDWPRQVIAIRENLKFWEMMLFQMIPLFLGALVLLLLAALRKNTGSTSHRWLWQIAWPLTLGLVYGLVSVAPRYLAPFLVLFWLAIYNRLLFPLSVRARVTIIAGVLSMLLFPSFLDLGQSARFAVYSRNTEPEYEVIGRGLKGLGLRAGDRLGIVGYAFDAYYARFARMQVTADILDDDGFWRLGSAEAATLERRLAASGVKALIARDRPADSSTQAWKDLPGSTSARFSVLLLGEASATSH